MINVMPHNLTINVEITLISTLQLTAIILPRLAVLRFDRVKGHGLNIK
jgi:hypothetical protein